jgi:hypothetical protein
MLTDLTSEDPQILGFVMAALFWEAISLSEFQDWCWKQIDELGDLCPGYVFDLVDKDLTLRNIRKKIGFTPSWVPTHTEYLALSEIARIRGIEPFEPAGSRAATKKALAQNPHVLECFRNQFPFLEIAGQIPDSNS